MAKIKTGIIGTGNIGSDLLMKVLKSDVLECSIFAGHNPESEGIHRAEKMGIPTTIESIHYIEKHPDCCDIVFDATSAKVHKYNAPILKKLGKYTIDLTPAHVGKFCIPAINQRDALNCSNVNMITCGGQAAIPIACALQSVSKVEYLEIVATIASKSAGIGTRNNIDEFTQTTKEAIVELTGIKQAKAIIVLNPAEPPITMHNTVYALMDKPDMVKIEEAVEEMSGRIKKYVPVYCIVLGPIYENSRVTIGIEVVGSGDYLPPYAGNLDIITCAAVETAEQFAMERSTK